MSNKENLVKALNDAAFIKIDGYWFRVEAWDGEELRFYDEESGEEYVNTLDDLIADMDEFEIYVLEKNWPADQKVA